MTQEELDKAVNKLISEANEESAAAKAEYEKQCLDAKNGAIERRVLRSGILQDALAELKEAYDALVLKLQKELDESLEALYAEGASGQRILRAGLVDEGEFVLAGAHAGSSPG